MRTGVGPKWDCWNAMGPTEAFLGPFWLGRGSDGGDWLARCPVDILAREDRSRAKYGLATALFAEKNKPPWGRLIF